MIKKSDRAKLERMRHRTSKINSLFYPEDQFKIIWDLFITLVLLISCVTTPYRIAFGEVVEPVKWKIINFTIDALFLIDIFVIFNSAYYDEDYMIIENRKQIAKGYIYSWFVIDTLAIIPFDVFLSEGDYQEMMRIARIGKISRLIKMTRLLRILKIVK